MGETPWADLDISAEPSRPGCFRATISDSWMLAVVPQGGIVAALAVRAMAELLGDETQTPRTTTAVFAGKVAAGPVEIEATVLRRGRSMSQLMATVRNPGEQAGRIDDPPVLADGSLDPLALLVVCDTMPGAVGQKLGPDSGAWFGPSVDLTVHLLEHTESGWLLAHNRARHAGDGYASVDQAVWTADGRLVAYATQLMFFAFGV